MKSYEIAEVFASLAQETRLKVFMLLIEYGSDGLVPGKIAQKLKVPDNTLSFHLAHMSKANLVRSQKTGRSISYYANSELIMNIIGYLQDNCCKKQRLSKIKAKNSLERKCAL